MANVECKTKTLQRFNVLRTPHNHDTFLELLLDKWEEKEDIKENIKEPAKVATSGKAKRTKTN